MDQRTRIINWIGISLSIDPGNLTESFYFDRRSQTFFSVHVADLFMLNEDLELDVAVSDISYSEKEITELIHWIKRIDGDDQDIVFIPKKGISDQALREEEASAFFEALNIDVSKVQFWEVDSNPSVTIDLKNE